MTNSKSPIIHVKAIKTKYFQVDTTCDRCLLFVEFNTVIGQLHIFKMFF